MDRVLPVGGVRRGKARGAHHTLGDARRDAAPSCRTDRQSGGVAIGTTHRVCEMCARYGRGRADRIACRAAGGVGGGGECGDPIGRSGKGRGLIGAFLGGF